MLTDDKITEIFVMADGFCKVFHAMSVTKKLIINWNVYMKITAAADSHNCRRPQLLFIRCYAVDMAGGVAVRRFLSRPRFHTK